MKIVKALFVVLFVLLTAAFFFQINETRKMQDSLVRLAKDRDSLSREVSALNRRVAETRREPTTAGTTESRAAPAAAQRVEEPPVPGITRQAPAGWAKNGSKPNAYVVGVDRLQSYNGMPSAYVKSVEPTDGFGGMMQMTAADEHLGKRLRLTGWVKTEDANDGGGHLWFRVDGQQAGKSLQFDNMDNRPIKGTTGWQQYSVVLDVPTEASALAYGFFVHGTGQMWVSGARIEPVGPEVASTNMITKQAEQAQRRALPKTPVNLSFDPDHPR